MMKAVVFVLAACVLATVYGQGITGASGGASSGMSSLFSGGGMNNQMLYMAALGGKFYFHYFN